MRARTSALLVTAVLAVYFVAFGWRAVILLRSGLHGQGGWVAVLLGLGLVVLPLLGAWAVWRELAFGAATERIGRELERTGGLLADDLPRSPGGRVDRAAADALFREVSRQVQAEPDSFAAWYRLSCAYDLAGDRRRARAAARHAVQLHGAGRS